MEEVIPSGEEVLWTGSVSHWHYAGRWFIILLILAGLVATFVVPLPLPQEIGLWVVRGVLAAVVLVLLIWMWIDRARRKYTVTSIRVSAEYGIFSRDSKEMRIQDIRSIDLSTSGISGLLGIGRVEFSSSSMEADDVVFWNVPGASAIRDRVRALQARS